MFLKQLLITTLIITLSRTFSLEILASQKPFSSMMCVAKIIFPILGAIELCKYCKGYNLYEKFLIESQNYTKEGEVFRTKSPTECLLRCGKRKCMNAIVWNEICQCTTTSCAQEQSAADGNSPKVQFYQSKNGLFI